MVGGIGESLCAFKAAVAILWYSTPELVKTKGKLCGKLKLCVSGAKYLFSGRARADIPYLSWNWF